MSEIIVDREYVEIYPVDWHDFTKIDVENIYNNISFEKIEEINIYLHIPFCPTICPFCSFNKTRYRKEFYNQYISAVKKEMQSFLNHPDFSSRAVNAIYVGGGTGSLISPSDFAEIINMLHKKISITDDCEISLECHPNTVSKEKLLDFLSVGVNRISLGIQSFQEENLKALGLIQTQESNKSILSDALSLGFDTVAMDLMYRLPNQKHKNLQIDLDTIRKYQPQGISAYSLVVEGTEMENNADLLSSDSVDKEFFELIRNELTSMGYIQFMQPDFSLPGHESVYVLNAWKAPQKLMIGFGAGAHTHYFANHIWTNIYSVEQYISIIENNFSPSIMGCMLTKTDLMAKYMVLGVRHLRVSKNEFIQLFDTSINQHFPQQIRKLIRLGWILEKPEEFIVTEEGSFHIDNISKEFYSRNNIGKKQPWGKNLHKYMPHKSYVIGKT